MSTRRTGLVALASQEAQVNVNTSYWSCCTGVTGSTSQCQHVVLVLLHWRHRKHKSMSTRRNGLVALASQEAQVNVNTSYWSCCTGVTGSTSQCQHVVLVLFADWRHRKHKSMLTRRIGLVALASQETQVNVNTSYWSCCTGVTGSTSQC